MAESNTTTVETAGQPVEKTAPAATLPAEAAKEGRPGPSMAFRVFKGMADGAFSVGLLGFVADFSMQNFRDNKWTLFPKKVEYDLASARKWTGIGGIAGAIIGGWAGYRKARKEREAGRGDREL